MHPGCASKIPGHCSVGEIQECILNGWAKVPVPEPYAFVMIMRDPLERVLSEFYYLAQHRESLRMHNWPQELYDGWPEGTFTPSVQQLRTWVQSPFNVAHNRQAKQITAPIGKLDARRDVCINRDTEFYYKVWRKHVGLSARDGLEGAINNDRTLLSEVKKLLRSRFLFVAVLERLDESKQRLGDLLGVDPGKISSPVSERSGRPRTDEIPRDILDDIRSRNRLDYAVYRHVESVFFCEPGGKHVEL